jgi:hypothetical protein
MPVRLRRQTHANGYTVDGWLRPSHSVLKTEDDQRASLAEDTFKFEKLVIPEGRPFAVISADTPEYAEHA